MAIEDFQFVSGDFKLTASYTIQNDAFVVPASPKQSDDYLQHGNLTYLYIFDKGKVQIGGNTPKQPHCQVAFLQSDKPTKFPKNIHFDKAKFSVYSVMGRTNDVFQATDSDAGLVMTCEVSAPITRASLERVLGSIQVTTADLAAYKMESTAEKKEGSTTTSPSRAVITGSDQKDSLKKISKTAEAFDQKPNQDRQIFNGKEVKHLLESTVNSPTVPVQAAPAQ